MRTQSVVEGLRKMNEYEKLKKAMKQYEEANTELLEKAKQSNDMQEVKKRERRIAAILECKEIMAASK